MAKKMARFHRKTKRRSNLKFKKRPYFVAMATYTKLCVDYVGLLFWPTLQAYNGFTQLQGPRVHLPLSYFSFHVITYHLVHGLSVSLPIKFEIPYLFTSGNHHHSPISTFRRHLNTHCFQLAYPATSQRPFTNAPRFCSFRLWRFINHLLTYKSKFEEQRFVAFVMEN